ncbi:unnamed protein product [Calypogeia fissa]
MEYLRNAFPTTSATLLQKAQHARAAGQCQPKLQLSLSKSVGEIPPETAQPPSSCTKRADSTIGRVTEARRIPDERFGLGINCCSSWLLRLANSNLSANVAKVMRPPAS